MIWRTVTAFALIGLAAWGVVAGVNAREQLITEAAITSASTQVANVAAQITSDATLTLEGSTSELTVQAERVQAALDARPAFLDAVTRAKAALDSAAGKVDTGAEKEQILAAQSSVTEARTPEAVASATTAVVDATSHVEARVTAWKAEQAAERARAKSRSQAVSPVPSRGERSTPSGGDWFANARAVLDAVGGSQISLSQYEGNCGGVIAAACTVGTGQVLVTSQLAGESHAMLVWTMTHELAHTYQLRIWDQIMASPTYQSMFGSRIELLANCMAYAHGSPRLGHRCSAEQVNWASNIWNLDVPG